MAGRWAAWLVVAALAGCSMPAPYQTYAPGDVPASAQSPNAITIYGATTTAPDMSRDLGTADSTAPEATAPAMTRSALLLPDPGARGVAICYNKLWNDPDAVKAAAATACGDAGAPQIIRQGVNLDTCPLMSPTRAVFSCRAANSAR
jgi:hypothetical protein